MCGDVQILELGYCTSLAKHTIFSSKYTDASMCNAMQTDSANDNIIMQHRCCSVRQMKIKCWSMILPATAAGSLQGVDSAGSKDGHAASACQSPSS